MTKTYLFVTVKIYSTNAQLKFIKTTKWDCPKIHGLVLLIFLLRKSYFSLYNGREKLDKEKHLYLCKYIMKY